MRCRELVDYRRLAFRVHLFVYITVQLLLVATWSLTSGGGNGLGYPWFVFPWLGWGIGLTAHYAVCSIVRRDREAKLRGEA